MGHSGEAQIRFRKPLLYPAELRDRDAGRFSTSERGARPVARLWIVAMTHSLHRGPALALAIWAASAGAAAAQEACRLEPIGNAEVLSVRDGRTLTLRDGRELRLAALETPGANRAAEAKSALERLAGGRTLSLKRLGPNALDRYGRLVAFASVADSPPPDILPPGTDEPIRLPDDPGVEPQEDEAEKAPRRFRLF